MQKYTSKNTSINITKLPAIYNIIDWDWALRFYNKLAVFDYGAGKIETTHLIENFLKGKNINYFPFDRYNLPAEQNRKSFNSRFLSKIFICSNVLNVIEEDHIVQTIIYRILQDTKTFGGAYFFKIYEGDKSGIGKQTGVDQYQKNLKTKDYLTRFIWDSDTVIYKNVITNRLGKIFLGGKDNDC